MRLVPEKQQVQTTIRLIRLGYDFSQMPQFTAAQTKVKTAFPQQADTVRIAVSFTENGRNLLAQRKTADNLLAQVRTHAFLRCLSVV